MTRYLRKQKGLTLIELMIAMVIGLLLLGGTVSMFISNKRVYREQESMGRLQENARFALAEVMHDIRMAGYTGCSDNASKTSNHLNGVTSTNILDFGNPIEGSEDGITIRFMEDTGLTVEAPYMTNQSASLHVSAPNSLVPGEIVAAADCDSTDIFQITNTDPGSTGTVTHNSGSGTPGKRGFGAARGG